MSAQIIDGKLFAAKIHAQVKAGVNSLINTHGITPGLAVVHVGDDPASQVYVRNKGIQTRNAGMNSFEYKLPDDVTQVELVTLIEQLNEDGSVHGILVQLPLPSSLDAGAVIDAISPSKDVDGFHTINVGRLGNGQKTIVPCTPLGCIMMLRHHHGQLRGKNALVVGRSNIVGKPMAQLLLAEDCTVTIAHRYTQDLSTHIKAADILVMAVGKPEMVPGDWIKPGATVIDVGINRIERDGKRQLVGDVDFDSATKVAGAITPVPGGVGPMTISCLLANTLTTCRRISGLPEIEILSA
ncbi:bifunctional methylenetetrahydrofolate dehydrogenase/methenyltetrahydrofolate cyclohydrolase FolD [Ochrobactrum sp. S46]|nr:bifunctional methylenetetrahydrofolate dehydrogenase/methenyltetrahydrofolate cyclohydrolase FolD [Ochrobactrum sp. S45]MBK0046389.1 bifunctional methylenetetrahydrofolate dehydrogenase/methenyltetrahydrofolate cyclohydrolase FolD [Ochrobactrum sp. S46]